MSVYKISAALMLCLIMMNGIYTGSTAAYVYSVSATCVNTFIGERSPEITTSEHITEISSTEKSTSNSKSVKKSPATGNTAYEYMFISMLPLWSILIILFKHKTQKG